MAKILVVEDERDIRDLVEFTLKYAGHEVVKSNNGADAIEVVSDVKPDLILMDVRMPRMTGYEACRILKTMDDVKDIPVVFLSAKGQQSEMESGMDAGAYDYILKPFAPDHLIKRVAEVLGKLQAQSAPAQKPATPTPQPEAKPAPAPGSTLDTGPAPGGTR